MKRRRIFMSLIGMFFALIGALTLLASCQDQPPEDNNSRSPIPDGEGRYTYMELNEEEYLIFVKYENEKVKSADFYDFFTYSHMFGLEFEYGEDEKLTKAVWYLFIDGEKKVCSGDSFAQYSKDGKLQKLEISDEIGDPYATFMAQKDGAIDVMKYGDVCTVSLADNYLVDSFKRNVSEDGEGGSYTVNCLYDGEQRITQIKRSTVGEPMDWEFVYREPYPYYCSIKSPGRPNISYTLIRDEFQNVVECKYTDVNGDCECFYRYTDDGVQIIEKAIVRGDNYTAISDHYENGSLKQYVYTESNESFEGYYRDQVMTYLYKENGTIEKETLDEKYKNVYGLVLKTVASQTIYDENGEKSGKNTVTKKYNAGGKLYYHDEMIEVYEHGKFVDRIYNVYVDNK